MIKISNLIKDERCPVCDGEIIIELDCDHAENVWIHKVWRKCSCNIVITVDEIREMTADEEVMLEGYKEKKGE